MERKNTTFHKDMTLKIMTQVETWKDTEQSLNHDFLWGNGKYKLEYQSDGEETLSCN